LIDFGHDAFLLGERREGDHLFFQCISVDCRLIDPAGAKACEVTAVTKQREVEYNEAWKDAVIQADSGDVIAEAVLVVAIDETGLTDKLLAVGVVEQDFASANRGFLRIDHLRIDAHQQVEVQRTKRGDIVRTEMNVTVLHLMAS
jgi:hypothetical protein